MFKKFRNFFKKPSLLFFKKNQTFNVPRNLFILVAVYGNFATYSILKKVHEFFLQKPIYYKGTPNFERTVKFYYFSGI